MRKTSKKKDAIREFLDSLAPQRVVPVEGGLISMPRPGISAKTRATLVRRAQLATE
jgi:hypothetical protein